MMMQEKFHNENNRSLNYTKIDRCQDNTCINNDEFYRQILHLNEHLPYEQDIKIIFTNRFRFILLVFLLLTCQSNAAPIYQQVQNQRSLSYIQQTPSPLPVAMVQLSDRSLYPQTYKVYRRFPNAVIPSYSNGAAVQVYDQQQQQQLSSIVQNPNELLLKRERQRRLMADKMLSLFDDDGNGQLSKDELYTMALRSNIFPKFHYYIKQLPT